MVRDTYLNVVGALAVAASLSACGPAGSDEGAVGGPAVTVSEEDRLTERAERLLAASGSLNASDDWTARKGVLMQAGAILLDDFGCTTAMFHEQGGFMRSASVDSQYFTYCGDYDRIDVRIISPTSIRVSQQNGQSRTYEIDAWSPDQAEVALQVARLQERLSLVSEENFFARRDIYADLVQLEPDNQFFAERLAYYQELDRQDEARIEREADAPR